MVARACLWGDYPLDILEERVVEYVKADREEKKLIGPAEIITRRTDYR